LCGMDQLLADLGFDLVRRREVVGRLRAAFAAELPIDGNLRRLLGDRYRQQGAELEALLAADEDTDRLLAPGLHVLSWRSRQWRPGIAALTGRAAAELLSSPLAEVAASYLHMRANRLLRSGQREQEMILYDLLFRLYASRAARARDGTA